MAVIGLLTLSSLGVKLYYCWPRKAPRYAACGDIDIFWYVVSGINLILNIVIWCMPLPQLWASATMETRRKVGLIATFGIGAVAIGASVIRTTEIGARAESKDISWDKAGLVMFNQVEVGCGIVSASMPALTPWFIKYWKWGVKRGHDTEEGQRSETLHGEGGPGPVALVDGSDRSSAYVVHGQSAAELRRAMKSSLNTSAPNRAYVDVADIEGCGILDASLRAGAERRCTCGSDCMNSISMPSPAVRRVGEWMEMGPIDSVAEVPRDMNNNAGSTGDFQTTAQPLPADKSLGTSTGTVPGACKVRRASSRLGGLLRPFSDSQQLWPAPTGSNDDAWSPRSDMMAIHSSPRTSRSASTPHALRSSTSGEVLLHIRPNGHQPDSDIGHHHRHQSPSVSSSHSLTSYGGPQLTTTTTTTASDSEPTTPSTYPTPLSPRRIPRSREGPLRDSIYPNPVEEQRGVLGLGDLDPVAGCILQLERIDTVESVGTEENGRRECRQGAYGDSPS